MEEKEVLLRSVYDMAYSLFKELVGFILKRFQATRKRSTGTKMKRMKDRRQEKRKNTRRHTHACNAPELSQKQKKKKKRNKNMEGRITNEQLHQQEHDRVAVAASPRWGP